METFNILVREDDQLVLAINEFKTEPMKIKA